MFWSADDAIYRANYDGSGTQAIVAGQAGLQSIAVNGSAGLLYWACTPSDPYDSQFRSGSLRSATVDGTSRRTLEEYETCYRPYTWWVRCDRDTGRLYRYFDDADFWPTRLAPSAVDDGKLQYLIFLAPSMFVVGEVQASMGGLTTMALDVGDGPAHYVYWTGGMAGHALSGRRERYDRRRVQRELPQRCRGRRRGRQDVLVRQRGNPPSRHGWDTRRADLPGCPCRRARDSGVSSRVRRLSQFAGFAAAGLVRRREFVAHFRPHPYPLGTRSARPPCLHGPSAH